MWGWGAYSDVTQIVAARRPLPIASMTSEVDEETGNFKVMWSLADNQGSSLTETTLQVWSTTQEQWIT